MPQAWAAIVMRPPSSVASATLSPAPSSPRRSASATRSPSNASSAVEEVCRPSLGISFETVSPSPARARNALTPPAPAPPVRANTITASAKPPFVIQVFVPCSSQSSPSRSARRRMLAVSRAGVGLGQRVAAELLAARERRQQPRLLLGRAVALDRRGGQPGVHRDGDREAGVVARELLDDQAERGVVEAGAAVLLGDGHAQHAELGQRAQRVERDVVVGVPGGGVGRNLALAELAHERLDLALGVGQFGDHGPDGGIMRDMADSEPALRLDVPRAKRSRTRPS